MKKLIAILLMLSLLTCLFTCFVSAETAPDHNPDAPVENGSGDDEKHEANDSLATDDTKGESEIGGADKPENHEFKFEPSNFVDNLYYMGVGMIGIFLVIGIIVLCTVGLNRIFSGKAKEE